MKRMSLLFSCVIILSSVLLNAPHASSLLGATYKEVTL